MPRIPADHSAPAHSKHQQHQQHHHMTNAPPVTSICSTLESSQVQPSILVACENGEVFVWDFQVVAGVARKRAIAATHFEFQALHQKGGATGSPGVAGFHQEAYNPLLRVAHKQSVLKLRPEDRNGVKHEFSGGRHNGIGDNGALKTVGEQHGRHGHHHSGIATCASTFSWSAHDETILAIKCVPPDPGVVFTSSQDGRIKVWDATHECVGTISTLDAFSSSSQKFGNTKPGTAGDASSLTSQATNGSSQGSLSSSSWKFTHYLSSDASQRHTQIAAEVIRKFKRRKLKAQRQQQTRSRDRSIRISTNSSGFDDDNEVGSTEAPPFVERVSSSAKGLMEKPTGIEAILAAQLPFSCKYLQPFYQFPTISILTISGYDTLFM